MAQPALHVRPSAHASALAADDADHHAQAEDRAIAWGLALCCFLAPALGFFLIMGDHIAGGDSGQWVMLARAYDGRSVPGYRDPTAVPPLAPMLVLGSEYVTGDPYEGAKLALALALGTVALAAFLLGRELFGAFPGVVGAALVVAGQSFFLRLASFGALPQLLALSGFAFALAAIAVHMRTRSRASRVALGLAAAMMLLAHVPTGVTALPIILAVLLAAPPHPAGLRVRAWAAWLGRRVLPMVPALAGAALYVLAKRDTFEQYLVNEATYYQRGLGIAIGELMRMRVSSLMFFVGGALLLWVLWRAVRAVRAHGWDLGRAAFLRPDLVRPAIVLALPAMLVGCMAVVFHLLRIGTDYPRIFPLAGLPAIVAVGALLPRQLFPAEPRPRPGRRWRIAAAAVVLLLFTATVPQVVAQEGNAVRFYSVRSPADLRDALEAVELLVPQEETIWTPIREGKWTEGITGRAALFALPAWAIFRPWEWERKDAAETLAGGRASMSTGPMTLRFQPALNAFTEAPRVLVYYKGDHYPVLRLDEAESHLVLGNGTVVPFAALTSRTAALRSDGGTAVYEQRAAREPLGASDLEVLRRATMVAGQPGARLEFEVRAAEPVQRVVLAFGAPDNITAWTSAASGPGAEAMVTRFAQPFGVGLQLGGGAPGAFTPAPSGKGIHLVVVPTEGATEVAAAVHLDPRAVGNPPSHLEALDAEEVLQRFEVRWALFPLNSHARERAAARALGFEPVHVNGSYELLFRGGAAA